MVFDKTSIFYTIFTFLTLFTTSEFVLAEESDKALKATTTSDPTIGTEALQIILNPMTKEELFVEADGWLLLLQKAAQRVSVAKLAVLNDNKKIDHEERIREVDEEIEERMEDIKKVENIEQKEELEEELEKDIGSDLEIEIDEHQEEVKDNIREEVKDDIKDELVKLKEQKNIDKEQASDTKDVDIEESKVDEVQEHKEDILAVLDKLRQDRRNIIVRFNVVISEINRKIGLDENGKELVEVMPYRRYIETVGGIRLDLTDHKSTWLSMKGYILSEDGGLKWLINGGIVIAILFAFWILSKILSNAIKKALSLTERSSQILTNFFINTVGRLTIIVGILVALSVIGISVAPIMAVIGAAGFIVAFALQGTLSNFASGIMIMLYRPFDVGNLIEVAGIMGKVESMTLVSTTIMTPDNKLMVVPNNSIWGDVITNAHYSDERRVDMVFGIGYDDDIEQSLQVMKQILTEHPLVLDQPQAIVQVHELADSSVNFVCRPWVETADYWTVYWDVTRMVKEQFDAAGISIPYPQTDVHIHQQTQPIKESKSTPRKVHQETQPNQFNEIDTNKDD